LSGEDGLFTIEKGIFVEIADVLNEVHPHHQAAAAHLAAVVGVGVVVDKRIGVCWPLLEKVFHPPERTLPVAVPFHRTLVDALGCDDVAAADGYLRVVFHHLDEARQVVGLREFHVGIGDEGISVAFFSCIAQADVVAGIVAPVFRALKEGVAVLLAEGLQVVSVLSRRMVVDEHQFHLHPLLLGQETGTFPAVRRCVVVEDDARGF